MIEATIPVISASVEMTLAIHSPGIAERFRAWHRAQPVPDYIALADNPPRPNPIWEPHVEAFDAGEWHVGVLRRDLHGTPEQKKEDWLWVHIFPHIPMWSFVKEFWEFLEAIGVTEYDLRVPDYLHTVRGGLAELLRRAGNGQGKKLIVLDLDGVVNTSASHSGAHPMNQKWHIRVAPECMAQLEWLLQETGAKILLSSSLRSGFSSTEWTSCLRELGAPSAEVIGITPDLARQHGPILLSPSRTEEIQTWLRANPEYTNVVVFDDDCINGFDRWFIRTSMATGLTMSHASRAVDLLQQATPGTAI